MGKRHDGIRLNKPVAAISTPCDIDFMQNPLAVSKVYLKEASTCKDPKGEYDLEGLIARKASQMLWAHGKLSEPIPNGFYSILLVSLHYYYNFLNAAANYFLSFLLFAGTHFCDSKNARNKSLIQEVSTCLNDLTLYFFHKRILYCSSFSTILLIDLYQNFVHC